MGRGDNRQSMKMRQRLRQKKHLARLKRRRPPVNPERDKQPRPVLKGRQKPGRPAPAAPVAPPTEGLAGTAVADAPPSA